jgi:hypothetical protein
MSKNLKFCIYLFVICLTFLSCRKIDNNELHQDTNNNFVSGEINVAFTEDTKLSDAFNLVDSLNLEIRKIWGQTYVSKLPTDSITFISSYLHSKNYIEDEGIFFDDELNGTKVSCTLVDVDRNIFSDWEKSIETLQLIELPCVIVFYLKTPIDSEKYWIEKFKEYQIVKWAALNDIRVIETGP